MEVGGERGELFFYSLRWIMPLRFFCALFFCQKFNKSFIICVETQSAANFRSAYLHQQQQCWSNTLHATGQLLTTFRTSIDTFTACWCVCRCVYFLFLSNFVDFVPSCFTIVCRNFDHLTVLAHRYRLISNLFVHQQVVCAIFVRIFIWYTAIIILSVRTFCNFWRKCPCPCTHYTPARAHTKKSCFSFSVCRSKKSPPEDTHQQITNKVTNNK